MWLTIAVTFHYEFSSELILFWKLQVQLIIGADGTNYTNVSGN